MSLFRPNNNAINVIPLSLRGAECRGYHLVIASETKQSLFLTRSPRRFVPRDDSLDRHIACHHASLEASAHPRDNTLIIESN